LQRWLAKPGEKILNLGGGIMVFDRWLTADMEPRADVFMDVSKLLPLPDACIDVVFSEEVIEHIPKERGVAMLGECFRILKPGGWLRLTTPSLDYFARRAADVPEGADEINDIFYLHGHRHIYAEAELRGCIEAAGFREVRASSYRDRESRFGHFDSHPARFTFAPPEWSQYWEARKPEPQ
jgi:predicted SAM-dependent methyltransferase